MAGVSLWMACRCYTMIAAAWMMGEDRRELRELWDMGAECLSLTVESLDLGLKSLELSLLRLLKGVRDGL